ncbi:hypothetical protein Tco_1288950 [Tanacetum coccineum]
MRKRLRIHRWQRGNTYPTELEVTSLTPSLVLVELYTLVATWPTQEVPRGDRPDSDLDRPDHDPTRPNIDQSTVSVGHGPVIGHVSCHISKWVPLADVADDVVVALTYM